MSAHVANVLHLAKGDVIDIMEDDGEYFLYVRLRMPYVGKHEGMVFPSKIGCRSYRSCSKRLSKHILQVCGAHKKVKLCVGEQMAHSTYGVMLPIVTKLLLDYE